MFEHDLCGTEDVPGGNEADIDLADAQTFVRALADKVAALAVAEQEEIARLYPKVLRRVGGYNLDIFFPQSERPYTTDNSVNLAHLLVGSEGTLAITERLTLKLSALPKHKTLGVVNFPSFYTAMETAQHIVKLKPTARFATICLHAGQEPDPVTGAIVTPIYQTSTYVQDALGQHKGFEYARTQNPTRSALEANLAAIEGGRAGFAFASGMSAVGAIAGRLSSGDHVIVTDNTYGGTFRLFDKVLTRSQLTFSYVDTADLAAVERAITPATRLLFVEIGFDGDCAELRAVRTPHSRSDTGLIRRTHDEGTGAVSENECGATIFKIKKVTEFFGADEKDNLCLSGANE